MRLDGISKHFGEGETRVDALRDVSLEVFPRQVVALLGPSGSGKTTLLNIIGCILDPSAGAMELDGELVLHEGQWQRSDLRRLRLEKIGFIFQFHNLLPFLDATDNVAVVLQLAGADRGTARRRAGDLLDDLTGLFDGGLPPSVTEHLVDDEVELTIRRARALLHRGCLPHDPTGRAIPWPLL